MGIATKTRMTEDEFMRMPDDGRKWKLVGGEPKEVPISFLQGLHITRLIMLLGVHAKGKGYMTVGKAGFRMTNGNIRCPDMSFTRREHFAGRELPEGFGEFAPDLCIEAILPCEEASEMMQKVREYFGAGAEQVWHLFPERKMVCVPFTGDFGGVSRKR